MKSSTVAAISILSSIAGIPVYGETWEEMRGWLYTPRECFHYTDYDNTEFATIEAPEGYVVQDKPGPSGKVLATIPGPASFEVRYYTDINHVRYYVDDEAAEASFTSGEMPRCFVIPNSNRSRYLARCDKPALLKKAKRESIYGGEVLASFFEQVVPLESTTAWSEAYRNAEIDFLAPLKVMSFERSGEDAWILRVRVFPSFDSRFISPQDEPADRDPDRWALTIKPDLEEVILRGDTNGLKMASVFLQDTVWVGGFSEGRLQHLRMGHTDLPPSIAVSQLSEPLVSRGETLSFRFAVQRLAAEPLEFLLNPDLITGADISDNGILARFGGPPLDSDYWSFEPGYWNIIVRSDQRITIVAPIFSERGAPGSLELESLDLGPVYQEDLAALLTLKNQAVPVPPADAQGWLPLPASPLGQIPLTQQAPELTPF